MKGGKETGEREGKTESCKGATEERAREGGREEERDTE